MLGQGVLKWSLIIFIFFGFVCDSCILLSFVCSWKGYSCQFCMNCNRLHILLCLVSLQIIVDYRFVCCSGFDTFKEEVGITKDSMKRGMSLDVQYDEQDMIKVNIHFCFNLVFVKIISPFLILIGFALPYEVSLSYGTTFFDFKW